LFKDRPTDQKVDAVVEIRRIKNWSFCNDLSGRIREAFHSSC